MSDLVIKINSLKNLLDDSTLQIPYYQRPYSWTEKQLDPLLHDLYKSRDDGQPIIMGGIILHNRGDVLDIVDGQQRLVTFSMIKYLIDTHFHLKEQKLNSPIINSLSKSSVTIENIKNNASYVKSVFRKKGVAPNLEDIFFVVIETKLLEDAFSFFDSQNTRGKALEPYDILKAHHLRYIKSDELAKDCAIDWEVIQKDSKLGVSLLLETLLMRARKWSKNQHYNHDIREEFKSQRTEKRPHNEYELFRYNQAALFCKWKYNPTCGVPLEYFFSPTNAIYKVGSIQIDSNKPYNLLPFQLTQTIEGGELFFWYTQKYYWLNRELFDSKNNNTSDEFKDFIVRLKRLNYNIGAEYTYRVFEGSLLFYYDKFGYSKFKEVVELLFFSIYWLRMSKATVQYASVYKYVREEFNPFALIFEASFPDYIITQCNEYLEGKYKNKPEEGVRKDIYNSILEKEKVAFLNHSHIMKSLWSRQ